MAIHGAKDGWNGIGPYATRPDYAMKYDENWALYTGDAFSNLFDRNPYGTDREIYRNTRLLWRHVEAIADFYAGVVYQGSLAAEAPKSGNELGGAIPFIAQAGNDRANATLLKACIELTIMWNWQMQMSQRPLYSSVLGDVLTELVDDIKRGGLYPQIIWPKYVVEIDIDYVCNVKYYALEYPSEAKTASGIERFTLRKEVDKESFRYFKVSGTTKQPYDATGDGPVVKNPYGFVPAIWDRHRIGAAGDVRGRSAIDGTKRALMEVNSLFSHAFDFQRKTFFAPMMLAAKQGERRGGDKAEVDVTSENRRDNAETMRVITVPENATLLQPTFDIGKTREMLQDIQQGILDENPEARFYQQLRDMAQVTAPGAERLMGDVKTRVDLVRAGMDSNTVKLFQMAIAICGFRAKDGSWNGRPWGRNDALTARQKAFLPFGLDSYKAGELDMSIAARSIVPVTEAEHLALTQARERLLTSWGMEQEGIDSTTAAKIMADRAESQWQSMNGGSYADMFRSATE